MTRRSLFSHIEPALSGVEWGRMNNEEKQKLTAVGSDIFKHDQSYRNSAEKSMTELSRLFLKRNMMQAVSWPK